MTIQNALDFTGTQYLTRTTNLINFNGTWARSLWVYLNSAAAYATFFASITGAQGAGDYNNSDALGIDDTAHAHAWGVVGGSSDFPAGPVLSTGLWVFLAEVRESATSLKLYIDGSTTPATTNVQDISARGAVGTELVSRLNAGDAVIGRIACIKQWNVSKTGAQMAAEKDYYNAVDIAGLHEVWNFPPGGSRLAGSINGYTWTATGTIADAVGPDLSLSSALTQSAFRLRNEDGSETTATWSSAENANATKPLDTPFRIRMQIDAAGDPTAKTFQLEYKKSSDATWIPVLAAAPSPPTYQLAGTAAASITTGSPAWPAHQTGDIGILAVESCGGEPVSLSTDAGFVQIGTAQATGATTAGTQITLYWCRATSNAMGAPTIADPGDHVYAIIYTFRGCIAEGNPVNANGGGVKASASTSVSVTGVTTTVENCLVAAFCTKDLDSAAAFMSAQSNGSLSSLTEQNDAGTTQGNGGGIALTTGIKAVAGATGTMTATVTSSINAFMTIALRPQPTVVFMAPSANIAGSAATATTAQLTAPGAKSSGADFQAGSISDDINPMPSQDITADKYTEHEWCITIQAAQGAANSDQYNFRTTIGGVALDTYTVSPTVTVGSSSSFPPVPGPLNPYLSLIAHT